MDFTITAKATTEATANARDGYYMCSTSVKGSSGNGGSRHCHAFSVSSIKSSPTLGISPKFTRDDDFITMNIHKPVQNYL